MAGETKAVRSSEFWCGNPACPVQDSELSMAGLTRKCRGPEAAVDTVRFSEEGELVSEELVLNPSNMTCPELPGEPKKPKGISWKDVLES